MKLKEISRQRLKAINNQHSGQRIIVLIISYIVLIGVSFVYLYPIIYMLLISLMPTVDLINPTIEWIPTKFDFESFGLVFKLLDYPKSFLTTLLLAGVSAVLQTIVCALCGYALARYPVPFKKMWVLILLIVFIIPTDVVSVPRFALFTQYKLIGSIQSIYLPALLGQGLKSSLFILLFMQSFSSYPPSYDEAAQLDGAGNLKLFFYVALPLALSIIVLSLLFSFIWYWNETSQTSLFLSSTHQTLPLQLKQFDYNFGQAMKVSGNTADRLNERIQMAATIMVIAPLALLYLVFKNGMIDNIESSGITGE